MCTNNARYEEECKYYVSRLEIPEGYQVEWVVIRDASSMTSGYNRAMKMSDAKYKIYVHQDVFIINNVLLQKILDIFAKEVVGMIGVVGNIYLPENGVQWYGERIGKLIERDKKTILANIGNREAYKPYKKVEAIDGLIMITQYDIPWREDLFDRFDFYDTSQSQEFIRAGYEVVVPFMEEPWVIHDSGAMNLKNYHEQRKRFVREYKCAKDKEKTEKRLLYYCWNEWTSEDIVDVFKRKGCEVDIFKEKMSDKLNDINFMDELKRRLIENAYDCIFTFNFFPVISKVADELGIKYISWNYDTPCMTLYTESVFNSCNYIFSFDKLEVAKLKQYGVKNVYHMPMAVNLQKLQKLFGDSSVDYKYDVSFVGNLYNDEYNFYDQIKNMPAYYKGFFDAVINAQMEIYGYDMATDVITDEFYEGIRSIVRFNLDKEFFLTARELFVSMLQKKITSIERPEILMLLSELGVDVTHFDFKRDERLDKVKYGGYLGYNDRMPCVFRDSKINLNITIRSNLSAIPLRCMDVMGAGGFLLSNYQPELAEYFVDGEEMAMYSSRADLVDKVEYYLNNDDKRIRIAERARAKIEREFTYDIVIEKIFDIAGIK